MTRGDRIRTEKPKPDNRKAIHCAFWMNSRCYKKEVNQALSEMQGRNLESSFCFKDTRAKNCKYFLARDKKITEAAVQKTMF